MMLASTVQFSRYGRPRHPAPCERRRCRSWLRLVAIRPFPQDPTACSAWSLPQADVPSRGGRMLAQTPSGRTCRPERKLRPNNQCSTNEQPSHGRTP
jgi:hypothetical protein